MKQLDDIIDLSTNEDASLAVILRKVLILSFRLKNQRLTVWANAELDGYASAEDLPVYRVIETVAYGTFTGPFGASIRNKSIPGLLLNEEHRRFADTYYLRDGIAAIQTTAASGHGGRMPWPANLVVYYQSKFIENYALQEAWLELPKQIFVGILDTVRTRTLRFALELREELGAANDDVAAIPPAAVEKTVTTYIFGGNVVVGGSNHRFSQTGSMTVGAGDQVALAAALGNLGFSGPEIAELLTAAKQDVAEQLEQGLGKRTLAWLGKIGAGIANAALSVSTDIAKIEAAKAISSYLGRR